MEGLPGGGLDPRQDLARRGAEELPVDKRLNNAPRGALLNERGDSRGVGAYWGTNLDERSPVAGEESGKPRLGGPEEHRRFYRGGLPGIHDDLPLHGAELSEDVAGSVVERLRGLGEGGVGHLRGTGWGGEPGGFPGEVLWNSSIASYNIAESGDAGVEGHPPLVPWRDLGYLPGHGPAAALANLPRAFPEKEPSDHLAREPGRVLFGSGGHPVRNHPEPARKGLHGRTRVFLEGATEPLQPEGGGGHKLQRTLGEINRNPFQEIVPDITLPVRLEAGAATGEGCGSHLAPFSPGCSWGDQGGGVPAPSPNSAGAGARNPHRPRAKVG